MAGYCRGPLASRAILSAVTHSGCTTHSTETHCKMWQVVQHRLASLLLRLLAPSKGCNKHEGGEQLCSGGRTASGGSSFSVRLPRCMGNFSGTAGFSVLGTSSGLATYSRPSGLRSSGQGGEQALPLPSSCRDPHWCSAASNSLPYRCWRTKRAVCCVSCAVSGVVNCRPGRESRGQRPPCSAGALPRSAAR